MKFKVGLLIVLLNSSLWGVEKHVIGSFGKTTGMFALFFSVLNHVAWCKKHNKVPVVYWDERCTYYQKEGYNGASNAWDYYFEPLSQKQWQPGDQVHCTYLAPDGTGIQGKFTCLPIIQDKKAIYALIKKYIRVKPEILKKVQDFKQRFMAGRKTIGIHLRGTDKHTEVPSVPLEKILKKANTYKGYQFFIATDDQRLLEQAKKILKGKVLYYDSFRSVNGAPVHMNHAEGQALRGEEVLIDVLLLGSCHKFLHTCSYVAMAVECMHPDLECVYFHPGGSQYLVKGSTYLKIG
jgi:hypothetical protein